MNPTTTPANRFSLRTWPYRSLIPNMITFFGLLLAFQAIIFVFQADYISAGWFICFATVVDLLDGASARLLNTGSNLGKQLDAFADLIACGLAPALLAYQVFLKDWGLVGLGICFVQVIFVAIRLGRFATAATHQKEYYTGLPVTVVADMLIGYVILSDSLWGEYRYPVVPAAIILLLCPLMVGSLRFAKSHFITPRQILRTWQGWGALGILLFVALFPTWVIVMPLLFAAAFITLGLVRPKMLT
jgi:CDP-diacylglycerol--serine O-phosphatidyltransferase